MFLSVRPMWQILQEELDFIDPFADPLQHPSVPVPILREEVPPEVRHEEAHVYSHW